MSARHLIKMPGGRVHVLKRPLVDFSGTDHRSGDRGFIVNSRQRSSWAMYSQPFLNTSS